MTTREKLESNLVNMGLFPAQATAIIDIAIPKLQEAVPGYRITWNRPFNEYPEAMYAVWQLAINKVALEWMQVAKNFNQNAPGA